MEGIYVKSGPQLHHSRKTRLTTLLAPFANVIILGYFRLEEPPIHCSCYIQRSPPKSISTGKLSVCAPVRSSLTHAVLHAPLSWAYLALLTTNSRLEKYDVSDSVS